MKKIIRQFIAVLLAFAASVSFVTPAFAWDGAVAGTIGALQVTATTNYGFRIFMSTPVTMCTGGSNFAYLNESDSNYKTYLSVLMLARTIGQTATIYTTNVGGQCQIGYINVSS